MKGGQKFLYLQLFPFSGHLVLFGGTKDNQICQGGLWGWPVNSHVHCLNISLYQKKPHIYIEDCQDNTLIEEMAHLLGVQERKKNCRLHLGLEALMLHLGKFVWKFAFCGPEILKFLSNSFTSFCFFSFMTTPLWGESDIVLLLLVEAWRSPGREVVGACWLRAQGWTQAQLCSALQQCDLSSFSFFIFNQRR